MTEMRTETLPSGRTISYPVGGAVTYYLGGTAPTDHGTSLTFGVPAQPTLVVTDPVAIRAIAEADAEAEAQPATAGRPLMAVPRPLPLVDDNSLLVASLVGPTLQGQGASTGRHAAILTLGACNLSCSWCNVPATWDERRYNLADGLTERPVDDLILDINSMGTAYTVVTGGEPLMQQKRPAWGTLLRNLDGAVEVETNGTITPSWATLDAVSAFNVSVKLAHAGGHVAARVRPDALAAFRNLGIGRTRFTFVVRSLRDFREVDNVADSCGLPAEQVWVQAEDSVAGELLQRLASRLAARGYNLAVPLPVYPLTAHWPPRVH